MQYPWFDGSIEQEFAIRSLAELCGVPTRTSETSKPSGSPTFNMVTCDANDAEAISTCQVLCHSAQKHTGPSSCLYAVLRFIRNDAEAFPTCQVLCHSAQKQSVTILLLVCCVAVHQE